LGWIGKRETGRNKWKNQAENAQQRSHGWILRLKLGQRRYARPVQTPLRKLFRPVRIEVAQDMRVWLCGSHRARIADHSQRTCGIALDIHIQAMTPAKRQAQSKVVEMIL
jgi:hypothetical protein